MPCDLLTVSAMNARIEKVFSECSLVLYMQRLRLLQQTLGAFNMSTIMAPSRITLVVARSSSELASLNIGYCPFFNLHAGLSCSEPNITVEQDLMTVIQDSILCYIIS